MSALYPLTFNPIFKERVWGARNLERLYGKKLPAGATIGESWEVSDRPGDASVINNGPLSGKDLHWLVENHRADLLGDAKLEAGRFPLLQLGPRQVGLVLVWPRHKLVACRRRRG